ARMVHRPDGRPALGLGCRRASISGAVPHVSHPALPADLIRGPFSTTAKPSTALHPAHGSRPWAAAVGVGLYEPHSAPPTIPPHPPCRPGLQAGAHPDIAPTHSSQDRSGRKAGTTPRLSRPRRPPNHTPVDTATRLHHVAPLLLKRCG